MYVELHKSSTLSCPGGSGTGVMIFKNIFAVKNFEKIGVFDSKTKLNYAIFYHNIGF
jgi:hypothetical protein